MKKLDDANLEGKKVLMRVDFNVPLDENGGITGDKRIRATIPTIKFLLDKGAKQIIMMSHLDPWKDNPAKNKDPRLKMDKVAARLGELIGMPVAKTDDCIDVELPDEKLVVLENLRFHGEEKKNDEEFAKKLASLADIYVNDAFGTCHRAHASMEAVAHLLPGYPGLLVQKELDCLQLDNPESPYVAIIGGAKISTKIKVVRKLIAKVDQLLLGGAMIFTFYKAQGFEIGKSKYEEEFVPLAKELLAEAGDKLVLPTDVLCASDISADAETKVVPVSEIPADMIGLDIGPDSIVKFKEIVSAARTIVWNGPLGYFELEPFAKGTVEVAEAMAANPGVTVIGGGDSAAAMEKFGLVDKVTHVSTGGGASLQLLEGTPLPAIEALK